MRIRWVRQEGDPREWELDPYSLLTDDAEAVEAVGGTMWEDFDEWVRLLLRGNRRALRAALWRLRRRDGEPGLEFDAIRVTAREIQLDEWGETEIARVRQRLLDGKWENEEQRAQLVAILGEDPTAGDPKAGSSGSPSPEPGSPPDETPTAG